MKPLLIAALIFASGCIKQTSFLEPATDQDYLWTIHLKDGHEIKKKNCRLDQDFGAVTCGRTRISQEDFLWVDQTKISVGRY